MPWLFKRKNPQTGRKYFSFTRGRRSKLVEGQQPPSIDKLPPAELEGTPLSKEKPESSTPRGRERYFPTFIESSQPKERETPDG